jgi:YbbR domain-containing protein
MRWLTNNLWVKLASLTLAIMLSSYVYLYLNYPTTQSLYLPLRIRNLDPGLVLVSQQPDVERVQIRVRGPYRSIKQLLASNHQATLDCSEIAAPGSETLRVHLPDFGDTIVTDQDPNFMTVKFDSKASATLKLKIDHRGAVQPGFVIADETLSARTVDITGPKSVVTRAESAQVEPDISNKTQDVVSEEVVRIYDKDALLLDNQALRITPDTVRYSLKLLPVGDTKPLTVVPDYAGLPPRQFVLAGMTADPAYVPVKTGLIPPGVFTVRTEPIDLSNAHDDFTVTVGLIYPFDLPADSNLPATCEVHVDIASLADETVGAVRTRIELRGTDARMEYVLSPPEVIVRAQELSRMGEGDSKLVRATLDVAGLKPGEHWLSAQISLPTQIEHVTIIPNIIKLTIIQGGK